MKLLGDFHTHTTYTHGTSTVEENVAQAENLGLKAIAITEHAYNSKYHIKKGDIEKIRADVERIKDKYNVKILVGIEANLIGDGKLDVADEELNDLDLVIVGYHKMSKVPLSHWFKFVLPNLIRKKPTKAQIERNTRAYLNVLKNHRVNILAHLNYAGCAVDVEKIANECVKRNVIIELNGKRINFSEKEIEILKKSGVKLIINSDAHSVNAVGKNHRAFNLIEKYNIPLSQVVNIDNVPEFN